MKIKTFTISVDELTGILSIDDPAERDNAIQAIRAAATDPDSIPDSPEGAAAPVIERIRRKAVASARAKARRQQRALAKERQAEQPPLAQQQAPVMSARSIACSELLARKLLRLKMTMRETFDSIIYIMRQFSSIAPQILTEISKCRQIFDNFRRWFGPMFKFATEYMHKPRHQRNGLTLTLA